jgi:hypothetical protein
MGLVDHEGTESRFRCETSRDLGLELRLQQALGRQVQQLVFASMQARDARLSLARIDAGIDRSGGNPIRLQQADLILHERDQRRDDDRHAFLQERRQLKAQRFAAAGRHDREHVAARERVQHDRFLAGAEAIEAEALLQRRGQVLRDRGWKEALVHRVGVGSAPRMIALRRRDSTFLFRSNAVAGLASSVARVLACPGPCAWKGMKQAATCMTVRTGARGARSIISTRGPLA